ARSACRACWTTAYSRSGDWLARSGWLQRRQGADPSRLEVERGGLRRSQPRASAGVSEAARAAPARGSCPGTTTDAGEAVGGRPEPSADLLRQLDDDSFRAADVAEPID